jgi:hypothetical protein
LRGALVLNAQDVPENKGDSRRRARKIDKLPTKSLIFVKGCG